MQDLWLTCAISLAAFAALCAMAPRWDTGSGFILILILGYMAMPVIAICIIAGALWVFVGYPAWRLYRWVRS